MITVRIGDVAGDDFNYFDRLLDLWSPGLAPNPDEPTLAIVVNNRSATAIDGRTLESFFFNGSFTLSGDSASGFTIDGGDLSNIRFGNGFGFTAEIVFEDFIDAAAFIEAIDGVVLRDDFTDLRALLVENADFTGSSNDDVIPGFFGDDVVNAGDGDDVATGDTGDDVLTGGEGRDALDGGPGSDTLDYGVEEGPNGVRIDLATGFARDSFGDRDDIASIENVVGTSRGDRIAGDRGANALDGGAGSDVIDGGSGRDAIDAGGGSDTVDGGGGGDVIDAGGGADEVFGGGGGDTIRGRSGADRLDGGGGRDVIDGGSQNDAISGAAGGDRIEGGKGDDDLSGGGGRDVFIYDIRNAGDDVISDFNTRKDRIEMDAEVVARFSALEISENGDGDAVIAYGRGSITLANLAADDLAANDFLFV